jgi:hypothetical protein
MLLAEEKVTKGFKYELHDKSENKRMARKGKPVPIHNAPMRRREPDDTETDSDHEISHFHDPCAEEEDKNFKV